MTRNTSRTFARAIGALGLGLALSGAALVAPALAAGPLAGPFGAAPAVAAEGEEGASCEVTGGALEWGVKESFRAYISSSIANGEWEVSDGASYETPSFSFSGGRGEVDAGTGEGSVSFDGTVLFTGHDGVLNLTLANPTIEFVGDGSGRLLLDTRSNDAEGELVIDETQVAVGRIAELPGIAAAGTARDVAISDVAVTLTAEGAEAFAGFYPTGAELDPLTLSLGVGPCEASGSGGSEGSEGEGSTPGGTDGGGSEGSPETSATPEAEGQQGGSDIPWLPIGLGAAALVVIAITGTLLVTGRKKSPTPEPGPGSDVPSTP